MITEWLFDDMSWREFRILRNIWEDRTQPCYKGYYDSYLYPLKKDAPEDFVERYEKYKESEKFRFNEKGRLIR